MAEMMTLDCGHTIAKPEGSGGTGYAVLSDDSKICYACATRLDVEALKRGDKFTAYVNLGRGTLTNWPGSDLMKITEQRKVSGGGFHFGPILYVRAKDEHGGEWYGRGAGDGMVISLHRAKPKKVRPRTTRDVWEFYVNYGQGWEHEGTEVTREAMKENRKAYRENCKHPLKIVKKRERIEQEA